MGENMTGWNMPPRSAALGSLRGGSRSGIISSLAGCGKRDDATYHLLEGSLALISLGSFAGFLYFLLRRQ
jgi:hypothetical protein